jgi:hypothetical protein
MVATEPICDEDKLKQRVMKVSKFFFIITMIYSLWIALIIIGTYFLQFGIRWATYTIEQWILSAIVLFSAVIALEMILLLQYILLKKRHLRPEKQNQPVLLQGKYVHSYTVPTAAKGGLFSKTLILIDENRVLNLRYQMIPPNDLWGQKQ